VSDHLRLGNAYCRSVLSLLSAQRPLDLRDASEVLLQNRALKQANSRHFLHVFPKAYVRGKPGAEEVNSVANIALIPADLNLRIGAKAPSAYLAAYRSGNPEWDRTLNAHVITDAARNAMGEDDLLAFIDHRATMLAELAQKVVRMPD